MRLLIWIADHALWLTLVGAASATAIRFEHRLPRRLHRVLLFASVFISLASPLLGVLKKSLDEQWKAQMQQQVAAALKATQPKPFKERLRAFCDSVDPNMLPALRAGDTKFHGFFYQNQIGQLRTLLADPDNHQYLKVEFGGVSQAVAQGIASEATIELDPAILQ